MSGKWQTVTRHFCGQPDDLPANIEREWSRWVCDTCGSIWEYRMNYQMARIGLPVGPYPQPVVDRRHEADEWSDLDEAPQD